MRARLGNSDITMGAAIPSVMIHQAESTFTQVVKRELKRGHEAMPASSEAVLF